MCQLCSFTCVPRHYVMHLQNKHHKCLSIVCLRECEWCLEYRYIPDSEGREMHYRHRLHCMNDRLGRNVQGDNDKATEFERRSPNAHMATADLMATRPACKSLVFAAERSIYAREHLKYYLNCRTCDTWLKLCGNEQKKNTYVESLYIYDEIDVAMNFLLYLTPTVPMDKESNIDERWIQAFIEMKDNCYWYHYSIPVSGWDNFFNLAQAQKHLFTVMPYWCICSGGARNRPFLHHRHIIVAFYKENCNMVEKLISSHSEPAIASTLIVDDTGRSSSLLTNNNKNRSKENPGTCVVKRELLKTPGQFMNTWRYISQSSNVCWNADFNRVRATNNDYHLYIAKPLSPHCFLGMAIHYAEGFQDMTDIMGNGSGISPHAKAKPLGDTWTVAFKELYPDLINHILPVDRRIKITSMVEMDCPQKRITLKSRYYFAI